MHSQTIIDVCFFYSLTYLAYFIPANGSFYFVPNSSKTQNLSLRRFWGVSVYARVCVCVSASACGWDCLHYQVHLIVYILSALPFKSFLIIISLLFVSYFSSLGGFFLKSMYSILFVVVAIRLLSSSLRMKGRMLKSCSH